ncbi:MAG: hypothetical protein U9R15_16880, partial [Chloroflexota bacterium]|nr:hypothetical protein [Chloroflexota bacterium]
LREDKEEALLDVDAARDTLKNLKSQRDSLLLQIDGLQDRADELERARDEIDYLKNLRRQKSALQERLDNYDDELRGYLLVVAQRLVLPLLNERMVSLRTRTRKAERTSEQLTRTMAQRELIKDLLDGTACVCGRELDERARNFLNERLKDLREQVASSRRIQERVGSYNVAVTELKDLEGRIRFIEGLAAPGIIQGALLTKYKLQVEREEVEQDIAIREKKLEGNKDADVAQIFTTLGEKRQNLVALKEQIEKAESDVKEAERALAERQKALNEAAQAVDDKCRVVDVLQMTLSAQAVAQEMVERMLHTRREMIERYMTNVFRMVTNKKQEYDRIELAEDFAPCVVTRSGQTMKRNELSAGEKEVVAFSFIAGLNQSTQTNAPLVMDTPFGHLDVSHRNGLLEALPKLPCQVILLATDRDLPEDELPNLAYCLGGRFDIIRDEIEERSRIESIPL